MNGNRKRPLYVLALTSGMRQGELLGLQYKYVDLDNGILTIDQYLTEVRGV